MMMKTLGVNPANPTVVRTPRTCARCGRVFGAIGREYTCPSCRQPKGRAAAPRELSFRERQIVSLVRQAKANKEIAAELCLTEGTVKEYFHRIFRKLDIRNRTELALRSDASLVYEPPAPRKLG
jgi:DNA-binding NarL/FixJ family response regulator